MRTVFAFLLILFINGCATKDSSFVNRVFQTNGATLMHEYFVTLDKLLLQLGVKLKKEIVKFLVKICFCILKMI